jgi:hypothetical protein
MAGLTSTVAGLLLSATLGGMGLPLGVPPGPEDPMLGRVAPEQCLFYLSWAGTASPDPKSPNQTEQLLAEPEVQTFLTQIAAAIRAGAKKSDDKPAGLFPVVDEISLEFLQCLSTHPGAVFVEKLQSSKPAEKGKPSPTKGSVAIPKGGSSESEKFTFPALGDIAEGGCVLSLGGDARAMNARIDKFVKKNLWAKEAVKKVQIDGRDWYRWKINETNIVTLGVYDGYFIAAVGEKGVEKILARMKKENPPKWLSDIREQLPIERRSVVIYANVQALGQWSVAQGDAAAQKERAAVIEMIGLSNARAWIEVWGLEGRDFSNKSLLLLDGTPRGLLQLLVQEPLKPEDIATIPSDATFAAAFRLDPQKTLDAVLASLEKMGPETQKKATWQIEEWERSLGIDLRHSTLKSLGDAWCVYGSPSEGNFFITGATAVVPLRDWAGMNVAYGRLMGLAKRWRPDETAPPASESLIIPRIQQFTFADNDVYCFTPLFDSLGFSCIPSWCMTKKEMVFAITPQNIKAFLARDMRHEPIGRISAVAELFSGDGRPSLIAYGDARRSFEMFYPIMSMSMWGTIMVAELSEPHGINPLMMPSCLSVCRHLSPTVAALRRTKHGIEFVSRGTIPLPSATAWTGWMALMGNLVAKDGPYVAPAPAPAEKKDAAPAQPQTAAPTGDKNKSENNAPGYGKQ